MSNVQRASDLADIQNHDERSEQDVEIRLAYDAALNEYKKSEYYKPCSSDELRAFRAGWIASMRYSLKALDKLR